LGPAQFEHGLDILAKKRSFNSEMIRGMRLNQARTSVVNSFQLDSRVFDFGQMKGAHFEQLHLLPRPRPNHTVPHDGGTRVNPKDDGGAVLHGYKMHLICFTSQKKGTGMFTSDEARTPASVRPDICKIKP
jgi:hypothetical protein